LGAASGWWRPACAEPGIASAVIGFVFMRRLSLRVGMSGYPELALELYFYEGLR
jgi:hypothetical protein